MMRFSERQYKVEPSPNPERVGWVPARSRGLGAATLHRRERTRTDAAALLEGVEHDDLRLSNGNGTFAAEVLYVAGDGSLSIAVADLDGDLDPDLAVANSFGGDVSILKNNGDGTFAAAVHTAAGDSLNTIVAGDLDGDLDIDLALTDLGIDAISVLLNDCPSACPADLDDSDDVGFADLLTILSSWGACPECAADLDDSGDVGFADLLTVLAAWGPCV